jgi:hypothetical protein
MGEITNTGKNELYECYRNTVLAVGANITSTDRPALNYVYNALKQEQAVLESIINIQLKTLLPENSEMESPLQAAAEKLTAAYENTVKSNEQSGALMKQSNTEVRAEPVSIEDFYEIIPEEDNPLSFEPAKEWMQKLDLFRADFKALVKDLVDEAYKSCMHPHKVFIYEMRKSITDKLILTDGIISNFRKLKEFYEQKKETLDKTKAEMSDIIIGINESVSLKMDALLEARRAFEDNADKLLTSYRPPDFWGKLNDLLVEWSLIYYNEMIQLDLYSIEYEINAQKLIQVILDNIKESYYGGNEGNLGKEKDKVSKMQTEHLRDYVLYEMGTYEEILIYSVAKLKESSDTVVLEYVDECEELLNKQLELLKRHGIDIIRPEPNSLFDAKEHEILIAEKSDTLKRGQIIKSLNSGFKHEGVVLVRANVIAAK